MRGEGNMNFSFRQALEECKKVLEERASYSYKANEFLENVIKSLYEKEARYVKNINGIFFVLEKHHTNAGIYNEEFILYAYNEARSLIYKRKYEETVSFNMTDFMHALKITLIDEGFAISKPEKDFEFSEESFFAKLIKY